jgi:competence protein ComEC
VERSKKKKIKRKISFGFFIVILLNIFVLAILDKTEMFTYQDLMIKLRLMDDSSIDADVSVHFIDVGQGDSILIKSKDKNVLIDAGERNKGEEVALYLKENKVEKLDYIIATHPHSDHIGGLPYIIENFQVSEVIVPEIIDEKVPTTQIYYEFLESVSKKGLLLTPARVGDKYDLGSSYFEILSPKGNDYDDLNDYSVVINLNHKNNNFLLCGDAETKVEKEMLNDKLLRDVDVLKAGHHGSSSSSSNDFLEKIMPEYFVVMCGEGNSYNHPSEKTIEKFASYSKNIYRTDINGNIMFLSNGYDLEVYSDLKKN